LLQVTKEYGSKEWLSRYLGQIAGNPINGRHFYVKRKEKERTKKN